MAGTSLQDPSGSARRSRRRDASAGSRSTRPRATRGSGSTSSPPSRTKTSRPCRATPSCAARCARTPSTWGCSPDKVLDAYGRHADDPGAAPTAGGPRAHRAGDRGHAHPRQPAASCCSARRRCSCSLLVFGLLSRRQRRPAAGRAADHGRADRAATATIDAVLVAQRPVEVTVTVDGAAETFAMDEGETLSFSARRTLASAAADGGAVQITVERARHRRAGGARLAVVANLHARRRAERPPTVGAVSRAVRVELVGVGTELLLGQIANTNAQWIGERLAEIGVDVLYHQVVGDNLERIVQVLELAAARADVVLVTGGLGPTEDDITRDAIADAHGRAARARCRRWNAGSSTRFAGFGERADAAEQPAPGRRAAGRRYDRQRPGHGAGARGRASRAARASTRCRACRARCER